MCAKPIDRSSIDLDALRHEFEKFRAGLGDVADKLGDSAHAALDQINAYLDGDSISSRMASVEDQLSSLSDRLKNSGKDAIERLEYEVCRKPLTSIAIATGVGLLVASLLRRR